MRSSAGDGSAATPRRGSCAWPATWRSTPGAAGSGSRPTPTPRAAARSAPGPDGQRVDLHRALDTLSRRQREVLVLRFLADLPEADVAKVLGCSVGSVKQHASRGLATLRTSMAVDDTGDDAPSRSTTDDELQLFRPQRPAAARPGRAGTRARRRTRPTSWGAVAVSCRAEARWHWSPPLAVSVAALTAGGSSGPGGTNRVEAASAPAPTPPRPHPPPRPRRRRPSSPPPCLRRHPPPTPHPRPRPRRSARRRSEETTPVAPVEPAPSTFSVRAP